MALGLDLHMALKLLYNLKNTKGEKRKKKIQKKYRDLDFSFFLRLLVKISADWGISTTSGVKYSISFHFYCSLWHTFPFGFHNLFSILWPLRWFNFIALMPLSLFSTLVRIRLFFTSFKEILTFILWIVCKKKIFNNKNNFISCIYFN